MNARIFLPFISLIFAHAAHAQAVDYLPPEDMVRSAIDNHMLVRGSKENINAARADAKRLRYGPHEWEAEVSYTRRNENNLVDFNEYDATLSRGVRIRGKARLDRRVADLGVEIAEHVAEDARHQAALQVQSAWMDWLLAADLLDIRQTNVDLRKQALIALESKLKLNAASELDVGLARNALERANISLRLAHANERKARTQLETRFPDILLPARAPKLPAPQAPEGMEKWVQRVIDRSHEILIGERRAERQNVAAQRARADIYSDPQIGVRVFSERGGNETGLGVVLSVPFGYKPRSAMAARERSRAMSAHYAAAYTRQEVELIARQDVESVQTSFQSWNAAQKAVQSSDYVISRMRRSYELGGHDYAQLLLAEQQHLESIEAEANARHACHRAWLRLQIDAHEIWLENVHE